MAAAGPWIEWQRSDIVTPTVATTGSPPACALDAFPSRDDCEHAAQRIAAAHGAKPGATAYMITGRFGVSRMFYTCLPKNVPVTW